MPDLIVNADDLGHAPSINRGIIQAHLQGIVTSTTTLITWPDAPAGLEAAQESAPNLGVGLHFNLSEGRPASDPASVPSLVDEDGRFCGPSRLGVFSQGWDDEEVERELRAQMARYIELAGHAPDHLDSHHGAPPEHPAGMRVMLALAAEYDLPMRQLWLSDSPESLARQSWILSALPPEVALDRAEALYDVFEAHKAAYRSTDVFNGAFYDRTSTLADLLLILSNLGAGVTELMCHPGYAEGEVVSDYWEGREHDLAALTHPAVRELIASEGIRLINYGELGR